MYICQVTGKVSLPGEKLNRIVVKTRPRVYTRMEKDSETGYWSEVEVGRGFEIVKEISATSEGVIEWQNMTDAQRAVHLRYI